MKKPLKSAHFGEHRYVTQLNGARPYVVYLGKNTATIYTVPSKILQEHNGWPESKDAYTKLVRKIDRVTKKFVPKYKKVEDFNATGNSILVQSRKEYIHIGDGIFTFKPEAKDEILKYFSPVLNSNMPYPIGVGKSHVYILFEKQVVSKDLFPKNISWEKDAANFYYEKIASDNKALKRLSGLKTLNKLPSY